MSKSLAKIPFKRKKEEELLDVGYFSVHKDRIVFPDKSEKDHYRIKRDDFIVVIPRLKDSFFMVRQFRDPNKYFSLEFPMGIAEGKSFKEMAENELREEVGIKAKKMIHIGEIYPASGILEHKAHVFLAEEFIHGEPEPESGEFLEIIKIKEKEFEDMIAKGEIKDAISLASYIIYKEKKLS